MVAACTLWASAHAQDYEALRHAVVKVQSRGEQGRQTGTGFIVNLSADLVYIVTAAHVVAGGEQIQVEFFTRRNEPVPARTVRMEERNDVALLEVRGKANIATGLRSLSIGASRALRSGDDLVCIGFPEGGGQWVVTKATFGDVLDAEFTLSGTIDAGSSGSPATRNGIVVGMVTRLDRRFARAAPAEILEFTVQGWGVSLTKPIPEVEPRPAAPPEVSATSASTCGDPDGCENECKRGIANACTRLGEINRAASKYDSAATLFKQGCDHGDPVGCSKLADLYLVGEGVPQNTERSALLFQQGCDKGNGSSCAKLALLLTGGWGLARDDVRAARLNRQGCDLGDKHACAELGEMYLVGRGVIENQARAATLLDTACDGGVATACDSLGYIYANGLGVTKDDVRAAALYRQACDTRGSFSRSASGCEHLASAYENGRGVEKNMAQAINFFRKACSGIGGSKAACAELKRLGAQ